MSKGGDDPFQVNHLIVCVLPHKNNKKKQQVENNFMFEHFKEEESLK